MDVGLCAGLALLAGRRRRVAAFAGLAIGYHVACWSSSGRTVGGLIAGQRVVAVGGSRGAGGQTLVPPPAPPVPPPPPRAAPATIPNQTTLPHLPTPLPPIPLP